MEVFFPEPVKQEQKMWSTQCWSSTKQLPLLEFGDETSRSAALHKHSYAVLTQYSTATSRKSNQDHTGTGRLLIATRHQKVCKITQITSGFQFKVL